MADRSGASASPVSTHLFTADDGPGRLDREAARPIPRPFAVTLRCFDGKADKNHLGKEVNRMSDADPNAEARARMSQAYPQGYFTTSVGPAGSVVLHGPAEDVPKEDAPQGE